MSQSAEGSKKEIPPENETAQDLSHEKENLKKNQPFIPDEEGEKAEQAAPYSDTLRRYSSQDDKYFSSRFPPPPPASDR